MSDPETIRLAAHTLLDAVSAFDDPDNPNPDPAIRTALARLAEINAVSIVRDDVADTTTVDIQPLLHASLRLVVSLVALRLRDHPELSGLQVVGELREAVDRQSGRG